MRPEILTELPGPKAKEILAKNEEYRYPKQRDIGFVCAKGVGVFQKDVDGNTFLDFGAGIAVSNTGSCHPRVVKAVQDQAAKLLHVGPYLIQVQVQLAEKMAIIAPGKTKKRVFFANSGTESVEAAIKLARHKTKRVGIISFLNGFHGRTFGSMSLTTSKVMQRQYYSPLVGGIYFTYYPYCYRCPINLVYPKCDVACLHNIEDVIFRKIISPEEIAAFVVEPIQGEGGYIVPPKEFHPRLKSLAENHGILFVADEVQTGMGRTGQMFAIEHWHVEPDITVFAKGVASGMPLGGIVTTEDTCSWEFGAHGSTFGGNPVSCAAALETISILEDGLIENARKVGDHILNRLKEMEEESNIIGEVRGKGLMIGIEIVEDKKTKQAAKEKRDNIIKEAFNLGLLVLGCSENVIRICPPLVIKENEADIGLELLERSIRRIEGEDN